MTRFPLNKQNLQGREKREKYLLLNTKWGSWGVRDLPVIEYKRIFRKDIIDEGEKEDRGEEGAEHWIPE